MSGLTKLELQNLNGYKGALEVNHTPHVQKDSNGIAILNGNGECVKLSESQIVTIKDTRILEMEKLKHIRDQWNYTNQKILDLIPLHVQINAALGVLEAEETQSIKEAIKLFKENFVSKKLAINNSKTPEEVVMASQKEYGDELKNIINKLEGLYK